MKGERMTKRRKRAAAGFLAGLLLCTQTMPVLAEEGQLITSDVLYTIGVVSYNKDAAEMDMFMDYYRDYIEAGFPVHFVVSDTVTSGEEENEFIRTMKSMGAQGIISFYGHDIESTVSVCEEEEMYYVLGSGTLSDEEFDTVKENPWFLGTVGPEADTEYIAGRDMAKHFADKGAKSCLLITGGAGINNFMHLERTRGFLEGLTEVWGLALDNIEELASQSEVTPVDTEKDGYSITLCPGYMSTEEGKANLEAALDRESYDAVLSCMAVDSFMDSFTAKEEAQGSNLMLGIIDCFSEQNFELVRKKDRFGNSSIDYVAGKYGSMAGPAFAMLYNAMAGDADANSEDGLAVRLYQGFWTAGSKEEYIELYGYTTGIYENAYSCDDLMKVIRDFNAEADAQSLKALAEAYSVDEVKERILSR